MPHHPVLPVEHAGQGDRRAGDGQPLPRGGGDRLVGERGQGGEDGGGLAAAVVGAGHVPVADLLGQVEDAGREVVDVDLQAETGRAAAVDGHAHAWAAALPSWTGAPSRTSPAPSSRATRLDTVVLVKPVSSARRARVTGWCRATCSRTTARFRSRIVACLTGPFGDFVMDEP